MCPQLNTMLKHPLVDGCLQSVLGTDYYVHLHRHPHMRDNVDKGPPGKVHGLHKDSMYNSRFGVDAKRRQHRIRMCMLMYFPQETPVELGPTAIMPKSHYLLHSPLGGVNTVPYEPDAKAIHLAGPAGTVGIVAYDMLHTSTNKALLNKRHMIKFLFSRMTEPSVSGPTWAFTGTPWQGSDNMQEPIWRAQYDWHCGRPDKPSWDDDTAAQGPIEDLAAQLQSHNEMEAVRASYTLGVAGGVAGCEELMTALKRLPAQEITEQELASKFDEADATVQAAYGLVEQGAAAVASLQELACSDEPVLRARAIDILGDIGPQAADALPTLLKAAQDDQAEDPRRRAVEAIGTVGCGVSNQVALCVSLAASLADSSPQVRRNAAYSLARLAPALRDAPVAQSQLVVSALAKTLTDSTEFGRGFSALALERIGTEGSFKAALAHLQTMRFD